MPRFALPTFLCPAPLKAAVGRIADAGADGVRLDLRTELRAADLGATAVRQLRHLFDAHGLKVGPAVFPTRGALHAADRLDERLAGLAAALKLAGELGCKTLSLRPFALPAGDAPERTRLREVLTDVAATGAKRGVIPCLTIADEPAAWGELFDAVTTGPIGVNLDPAAVTSGGGDVTGTVRALPDRVETVTARDALAGGGGKEMPVGRGEVDWEQTLAVLHEAGFAGWITADRTTGPDPFAEASRAITYLREVARA